MNLNRGRWQGAIRVRARPWPVTIACAALDAANMEYGASRVMPYGRLPMIATGLAKRGPYSKCREA
jgi:hypothetical protein